MDLNGLDDISTLNTPLLSRNLYSWKTHRTFTSGLEFESNQIINEDKEQCAETIKQLSWEDIFPQILASVVAFMLVTQPGINMVYSNIFLNHYKSTDVSELSWLTGILVLCTPIGAIVIGVIMDRVGRKNAFILTCVPLLISWSLGSVAGPDNMGLIYTCRFFAGIGGGMTSMVVIYVSEISHSSYRQVLLSLNSVFFSVGVLFATAVGSVFRWQTVNLIFFIFTAVSTALLVVFLPESPVWLTKFCTDRVYEAKSSLKRIYPKNDQVFKEEWDRLYFEKAVALKTLPLQMPGDLKHKRRRRGRMWWCMWSPQPPSVIRPVRILAIVFLLQQLSGCYPVIFYAVPVFRSVVGSWVAEDGAPSQIDTLIMLGVVRLLTSVVACALSVHVGRRPLLIASSLAMAGSAILVALTCPPITTADAAGDFDVYTTVDSTDSMPFLPLFGVAAFVCSGSAGVLVFPWTLVGELLPVSVRAKAGALLVSYAYVLMFIVLKAFPYLVALNSKGGAGGGSVAVAFAAFAAVSLALAAYAHACLPETLGKQFHEIKEFFSDPPTADTKPETAVPR